MTIETSGNQMAAAGGESQVTNSLMGLRLAYLRAIAKSWRDEEFKQTIVTGKDILGILEREFGFHSPWQHLELHLVNDEPKAEWKPMETAGWIGSNDRFVIHIPKKPDKATHPEQALAAYYQMFPTLFGPVKNNNSLRGPLPLGLGVGPEPFLEFGAVTLRAIALGWKNETFWNDLTTKKGSKRKDAKPALSRWLGYNCPWNFDLSFVEHQNFIWQEDGKHKIGVWNPPEAGKKIPNNIIELHYPEKPEDETFYAIALTSYNSTGPAYPFSCV